MTPAGPVTIGLIHTTTESTGNLVIMMQQL